MTSQDQAVIETARRDGIAVLEDVLDQDELTSVRDEFDRLHLELGKGPGEPGVRDGVSGDALLKYPHVAALFSHPRIIAVVAAMLDEDEPCAWRLKTNRYTPEHKGVKKHTDGVLGELAPAYTRQSMAVFLDDIDANSGALTYVPGSHQLHFESATDPGRQPPTQEDIDAGDYLPATLRAGSVVMWVPEVWHAVIPIHRVRRYVTASYMIRGTLSRAMSERVVAERERRAAGSLDHMPRQVDLRVQGFILAVEHHEVGVVEQAGHAQFHAAAAVALAVEDQTGACQWAERDRHGVPTDPVVHDLVPPADVVRVGTSFAFHDNTEDQVGVGEVVHLVPTHHLRIGHRRDGSAGSRVRRADETRLGAHRRVESGYGRCDFGDNRDISRRLRRRVNTVAAARPTNRAEASSRQDLEMCQ